MKTPPIPRARGCWRRRTWLCEYCSGKVPQRKQCNGSESDKIRAIHTTVQKITSITSTRPTKGKRDHNNQCLRITDPSLCVSPSCPLLFSTIKLWTDWLPQDGGPRYVRVPGGRVVQLPFASKHSIGSLEMYNRVCCSVRSFGVPNGPPCLSTCAFRLDDLMFLKAIWCKCSQFVPN